MSPSLSGDAAIACQQRHEIYWINFSILQIIHELLLAKVCSALGLEEDFFEIINLDWYKAETAELLELEKLRFCLRLEIRPAWPMGCLVRAEILKSWIAVHIFSIIKKKFMFKWVNLVKSLKSS